MTPKTHQNIFFLHGEDDEVEVRKERKEKEKWTRQMQEKSNLRKIVFVFGSIPNQPICWCTISVQLEIFSSLE